MILSSSKIVTVDRLLSLLKNRGKSRVVFTNGCFDILHAGHVHYLEKAKAHGEILIIALNSDQSVKKLKGDSRPIHTLKDRMKVIAALAAVDYVISFSSETPLALIKKIMPDILVKGADYQVKDIVGADAVITNGGKVLRIPLLKGRSTSAAIKKAKLK